MKKFFFAVLVAGSLAACNNSGESTTNADSATADSMNTAPVTPTTDSNTMNAMPTDTSMHTMGDSTMKGDTTMKK